MTPEEDPQATEGAEVGAPLVAADEVAEDGMIGVETPAGPVVVLRSGGALHAYEDRCAHARIKLSEGELCKGVLTCTAHFWSYDACTGEGVEPPAARLRPVAIVVRDGLVYLA